MHASKTLQYAFGTSDSFHIALCIERRRAVHGAGERRQEMVDVPPQVAEGILGAAGVIGAVAVLLITLGVGWYVVWCTSLRDLPIAQEMMGKRRQSQAEKDKIAKEIRDIKRQHSRRGASLDLLRQTSLSRQVCQKIILYSAA
jgi:hypothetical protein